MNWKHCLAGQSRRPTGMLGRLLMGRYLDRANAGINQLVYDTLGPGPQDQVLELGFGGADLLLRIAASLETGHIDGVDLSHEMVERAGKRARKLGLTQVTGFHQGSIENLPFDDASFDCACSVHTIYFWPDLDRGLAELARVIKPGGRLVLGFSAESVLREDGWVERGFSAYSNQRIADAYRVHGFTPGQLTSIERKPRGTSYAYCGVRS